MAEKIIWEKVDKQILLRMVEESETFLKGMQTAAISMSQRSATLGGIFTAAATAIFGASLFKVTTDSVLTPLVSGGVFSGGMFVLASFFCLYATTPGDYHIAGNEPKNWYSTIAKGIAYEAAIGKDLESCQRRISADRNIMQRASKRMKWGTGFGIAAPLAGILIASLLIFLS